MAAPMTIASMGATALGGIFGAMGAQTKAQGEQLGIQGQILNTIGSIFGLNVQAAQYGYQANVADYQAGVAKVNQDIALQNASYSRDVGETDASISGMQTRSQVSQAKATQGASGLDVNVGSAVNVRESMVEIGEYNQSIIRANAAKQAYGYEVEAMQDESQSDLYTYGAANDRAQAANTMQAAGLAEEAIPLEEQAYQVAGQAGDISSMASLVSAGGSVAAKWGQASQSGVFS